MDGKAFNKVIKDQQKKCSDMLTKKADEYATADLLHNFKKAANLRGCNIAQAALGMMSKHTVSVYDMVESGEDFPMAVWEEKITDHINYLLLIKANVVEMKSLHPKD